MMSLPAFERSDCEEFAVEAPLPAEVLAPSDVMRSEAMRSEDWREEDCEVDCVDWLPAPLLP